MTSIEINILFFLFFIEILLFIAFIVSELGRKNRVGRIFIHEAGHALVAWYCPSVLNIEGINIHDSGGRVRFSTLSYCNLNDWHSLVVYLAGIAAESMFYKTVSAQNSELDLTNARITVGKLISKGFVPEVKSGKHLPFYKMFV